jgi:hypothetical protein
MGCAGRSKARKSSQRKGQLFFLGVIFLVGLIFVVQQILMGYTSFDVSQPPNRAERFSAENIVNSVKAAVAEAPSCLAGTDSLKTRMDEMKQIIESGKSSGLGSVSLDYIIDCTDWSEPGANVLNLTVSTAGAGSESRGFFIMSRPEPPVISIPDSSAGHDFIVDIPVRLKSEYYEVSGLEFTLEFLPTVLEFQGVYGAGKGAGFIVENSTINQGKQYIMLSRQPWQEGISKGDGKILDLQFRVVGNDGQTSPLNILDYTVTDMDGSPIEGTTKVDGLFTVIEGVPPKRIMVTIPATGASCTIGQICQIAWASSSIGSGEYLKIELYTSLGALQPVISPGVPNTGFYSGWTVPVIPEGDYYINISLVSDPSVYGRSLGTFSIASTPRTITVSYPTIAGLTLNTGSRYTLQWTNSQNMANENVKIDLYKSGIFDRNLGTEVCALGGGSYVWDIPPLTTTGSDYRIKVTGVEHPAISDSSDNDFTIAPLQTKSILVTIPPDGSAGWVAGRTYTITWSAPGMTPADRLKIELYKGGSLDSPIIADTENDGTYIWSLPFSLAGGNNYAIKISSISEPTVSGTGSNFNIIKPSITVLYPNAKTDMLRMGDTCVISWRSDSVPGNVNITLERHILGSPNPTEVFTIADSAPSGPSGGTYIWNVPTTLQTCPEWGCFKIRIANRSAPFVNDSSDYYFNITQTPTKMVNVTYPNGGESLELNGTYDINWTSQGVTGNVIIDLYTQSAMLREIAKVDVATGRYRWTAASPPYYVGKDYRIYIHMENEIYINDFSNGYFNLNARNPVRVIQPNGGENVELGSTYEIKWATNGTEPTENVHIELLKSGVFNRRLTERIGIPYPEADDGSFMWTVPSDVTPGSDYKINVSKEYNTWVYGLSGSNFNIISPTIAIIAPNGGENWEVNQQHEVKWTSSNAGNRVKIQLVRQHWPVQRTYETDNDGSYTITPDVDTGDDYTVKITGIDKPAAYDESDNYFSMIPQAVKMVTVKYPNGGNNLALNSTHTIRWESQAVTGTLVLQLLSYGGVMREIARVPVTDGSYAWTASHPTYWMDRGYQIRAYMLSEYPTVEDSSDSYFSLYANNPISVIQPNGGEPITYGSFYQVKWATNGTNPGDYLKLNLYKNDVFSQQIFPGTPDTGSYNWPVTGMPDGNDYKINISSVSYPWIYDMSDNAFTIKTPSPNYVKPVYTEGRTGDLVYVPIYMKNMNGIKDFSTRLRFNASILTIYNIELDFRSLSMTLSEQTTGFDSDNIAYVQFRISSPSNQIGYGEGSIAKVYFQLTGSSGSRSFINMSRTRIYDYSSGAEITGDFEVTNSTLDITDRVPLEYSVGIVNTIAVPEVKYYGKGVMVPLNMSNDREIGYVYVLMEWNKSVLTDLKGVYLNERTESFAPQGNFPSGFSLTNYNDQLIFITSGVGPFVNLEIQVNDTAQPGYKTNVTVSIVNMRKLDGQAVPSYTIIKRTGNVTIA